MIVAKIVAIIYLQSNKDVSGQIKKTGGGLEFSNSAPPFFFAVGLL